MRRLIAEVWNKRIHKEHGDTTVLGWACWSDHDDVIAFERPLDAPVVAGGSSAATATATAAGVEGSGSAFVTAEDAAAGLASLDRVHPFDKAHYELDAESGRYFRKAKFSGSGGTDSWDDGEKMSGWNPFGADADNADADSELGPTQLGHIKAEKFQYSSNISYTKFGLWAVVATVRHTPHSPRMPADCAQSRPRLLSLPTGWRPCRLP